MISLLISRDGEDGLEFDKLKKKHGPFAYNFRMDLLNLDPGEQLSLGEHTYKRVDNPFISQSNKDYSNDPGRTKSGVKIRHDKRGQEYINSGELLASENIRKNIRLAGESLREKQKDK